MGAAVLHVAHRRRLTRLAEFDRFFTDAVRGAGRPSRTRLKLDLEPSTENERRQRTRCARRCAARFTFTLTATGGALELEVAVPERHVDVLDALAARVADVRA